MDKRLGACLLLVGVGLCLPLLSSAQDVTGTGTSSFFLGMQGALEQVYNTMMVNCGELVGIGRSLAGFGALLYISYRVWGHLARAEAIDFFPLLRPFALGLVITFYPAFIGLLNGVLQPTVTGTVALAGDANAALTAILQMREQSPAWQMFVGKDGEGDQDKWEQYSGGADSGMFSGLTNALTFRLERASYNFHNTIRAALADILEVVYEAAALCINTLRTFYLVLLAILGPLVLGLSAFDGFKNLLTAWLARYINVFLWLPVANIFASLCAQVQVAMIKIDQQQAVTGDPSFGAIDSAYIIFLIMAIIGYFCVPSITSHIINVFPSGGGAHLSKMTAAVPNAAAGAEKVAGAIGS